MREFTKVSPTLWRSRKFRSLPDDKARMAYLYILTCSHGNSAGCFDLPMGYAIADLGWSETVYMEAFDSLCRAGLVEWDGTENTLWVVNWDEYNEPTNPKHALGLMAQLDQASSKRIKTIAFHAFLARFKEKTFDRDQALRKAIDIFLKAYPKPIATEMEMESETETERRQRGDLDKTETRENSRSALRALAANGALAPEEAKEEPDPANPPKLGHLLETSLMQRTKAKSA